MNNVYLVIETSEPWYCIWLRAPKKLGVEKDDPCLAKIEIPHGKCLKPSEGLYLDVKKSPVNIVEEAQYHILLEDYLNYTWFQNDKKCDLPVYQG